MANRFEPLSWLTLERYALGELAPSERARVEAQIAESPEDRACLDSILNDLTPLPELPVLAVARANKVAHARKQTRWATYSGALAVAAAALLLVLRPESSVPARRMLDNGVKGGEIALSLYSDRQGEAPTTFRDDERFKLFVSCPPGFEQPLEVLVFQAGQRYRPLARMSAPQCSNHLPWPGAFSLDGAEDVEVCVTWSERADSARKGSELGDDVVCTKLRRAP
jgi:hypothetical protein